MRIPLDSTLEAASRPHLDAPLSSASILLRARRTRSREVARAVLSSLLIVAVAVGLWWWKPSLSQVSVPAPTTTLPVDSASSRPQLPRPAVLGYWGDHRASLTTEEVAGRCPDRPAGSYLEDYPYPVGGLAMIRDLDGRYSTCAYGIDRPGDPVWYTTMIDDVATAADSIAACSRHLGYDFTDWTVLGHADDIDWGPWDATSGDLDRPGIQRLIGLASLDGHVADCNLAYPGHAYGSVRDLDEFDTPGVTVRLTPEFVPEGSSPRRVSAIVVEGVGVVLDANSVPDARAVRVEAHFRESAEVLTLPVVDGWIVSSARLTFDTPIPDATFDPTWEVYDTAGALIGVFES